MRILLLTPPMTQLNTPYPATAYLTGFLRSRGYEDTVQADPALELVLRLFGRDGLGRIHKTILETQPQLTPAVRHFLENFETLATVAPAAVRFLQGKDPSLALRIASRSFLPEGPRFIAAEQWESSFEGGLDVAFGSLGIQDRAKFFATLFLDDLADAVRDGVDSRFEFSRYGEKLAASEASFEPLAEALSSQGTLIDEILGEITVDLVRKHQPQVVVMTAPFPGNVYGAFRMAQTIRKLKPDARLLLGGGYVNTELRELAEPRVFDFFDYLTLDDGERPLLSLLEVFEGKRDPNSLLRTARRVGTGNQARVEWVSDPQLHDLPHRDTGTPSYAGLPIENYLSLLEMLNPMHRIWSDGRWNKLTLAHGCYWKKCNFCDVTLDYIGRYDPAPVKRIVDQMEALMAETGQSGFHFVDEAAPPALLKGIAEEILARGLSVTWWGNVRFERAFTSEVAQLLARSGCVAVSGGLEVASDRLLKLMNKGVTVEQVARVTRALTDAGVLVHAYLMYGFPTQTEAETVDALERVRQLFAAGCIQSAYWHRFSATVHSPIGQNPNFFGIRLVPEKDTGAPRFARNDLKFNDPTGTDHELLGLGLRKALYNFMHGLGMDEDVRVWFDRPVPKAKVDARLVAHALSGSETIKTQAKKLTKKPAKRPAKKLAKKLVSQRLRRKTGSGGRSASPKS